jgi:hypothetical protein
MARFMRAIHFGQAAPPMKMDGPDKPSHDAGIVDWRRDPAG